jgi:hypothetical protein
LIAVVRIDQAHVDAQMVAAASHASFNERLRAEQPPDLLCAELLALDRERGRLRHDTQSARSRQSIGELLRQPIAEVFIVDVAARIHERQHSERIALRGSADGGSACRLFLLDDKETADREQGDEDRRDDLPSNVLRGT